jgi:hypothetical protein
MTRRARGDHRHRIRFVPNNVEALPRFKWSTSDTFTNKYGAKQLKSSRGRKLPRPDPPPQRPEYIRPRRSEFNIAADQVAMGHLVSHEQRLYTWRGLANPNARRLELRELKERPDLIDMDIIDRVGKRTYAPGTAPPKIMPAEEQEDQAS